MSMAPYRCRITKPQPGDLIYWALLAETDRVQLEADRQDAIREQQEYMRDTAMVQRPSVPAVPGYDAAARRLGCEDQYEDDLRARYGDDF